MTATVVWYMSTMANTVRLQVLVSEEISKKLDKARYGTDVSAYIRALLEIHLSQACTKCGK